MEEMKQDEAIKIDEIKETTSDAISTGKDEIIDTINNEQVDVAVNEFIDYVNNPDNTIITDESLRVLNELGINREATENIKQTEDLLKILLPIAGKYSLAVPVILGKLGLQALENFPEILDALTTGSIETLEFIFNNADTIGEIAKIVGKEALDWFINTKLTNSKVKENYALETILSLCRAYTTPETFEDFLDMIVAAMRTAAIAKNWKEGLADLILQSPKVVTEKGIKWKIYSLGDFKIAIPDSNVKGLDVKVYKIKPSVVQSVTSSVLGAVPFVGGFLSKASNYLFNKDDMEEIENRLRKASKPEEIEQILMNIWNMMDSKVVDSVIKDAIQELVNNDNLNSQAQLNFNSEATENHASDDSTPTESKESLNLPALETSLEPGPLENKNAISPALIGLFEDVMPSSTSGGSESDFVHASRGRKRKKY